VGQLYLARQDIPIYMSAFTKTILSLTNHSLDAARLDRAVLFEHGVPFIIGDMKITPFAVDHCGDSSMFVIESDGKKILYTGDFRTHGFHGKDMEKVLDTSVHHVDALITEGTLLFRGVGAEPVPEADLQKEFKKYINQYKYVFVLCSETNFDRMSSVAKALPPGKHLVCSAAQKELIDGFRRFAGAQADFYGLADVEVYGHDLAASMHEQGFAMIIPASPWVKDVIKEFHDGKSIVLYSMWSGYRNEPGSIIPDLLELADAWTTVHTSSHTAVEGIKKIIDITNPDYVIPVHTETPDLVKAYCTKKAARIMQDKEILVV
jgi:ribonuclease J